MKLDPDVKEAIESHPSNDVTLISKEVSAKTGRFVPVSMVVRVRGSLQRAANVNIAKERASTTAGDKVQVIEDVSGELLTVFNDPTLPLKDRLEASKELRQWTKLGLDTAGIHDEASDTLFVIEDSWNMVPEK